MKNESYPERMDRLRAEGQLLKSQEISPKEHMLEMMDRVKKEDEERHKRLKRARSLDRFF